MAVRGLHRGATQPPALLQKAWKKRISFAFMPLQIAQLVPESGAALANFLCGSVQHSGRSQHTPASVEAVCTATTPSAHA